MTTVEIPMTPEPQTFLIDLASTTYQLTLHWIDAPMGGWLLDIADNTGTKLLCGAPLVTGHDLLEQYEYLGIGGSLTVTTDGEPDAVPTFANLGVESHFLFTTP